MSYYRSYFSKNNTIIKNSQVNTAKNPNTEIFYGSGFSKFIFQIDLSGLQNRINNGDFVLNGNTRHFLHLANTIFGDEGLKGQKRGTGRQRTSSFDLTVFRIPEFWDEGVGYDYEEVYDYTTGNVTFDVRPSNWESRTTLDQWGEAGIYAISGDTITKIHFDNGDENINVDITDYINSVLSNNVIDYGIGLAFDTPYMDVTNEIDQSVAFFTKYTQTFFEPYLETIFNDTIDDNRENFFIDAERNLYLYVNYMDNAYDLDELPTVDMLDSNMTIIGSLSGLTTTKVRKGVYKVTFGLSGQICDGKRFYYDKWCNLKINQKSLSCVTQKFIPKPFASFFDIGINQTELNRYAIQFFGVSLNEKIKRGTKRKIVTTFKSINSTKSELLNEVYYRIYVKEGKTQVNVFDWTKMDRTNENSFILDTDFMIPREYWIEIKGRIFSEDIFYRDEIKFEIISEKIIGWQIPSITPSPSKTPSITPSLTPTPSITPSLTPTPSITPSLTPTPSITLSPTPTLTINYIPPIGFKTEWTVSGDNAARTITLPFTDNGIYNATVIWGDGADNSIITGYTDSRRVHTYDSNGTYIVEIQGEAPGWGMSDGFTDASKCTNIIHWGNDIGFGGFSYLSEGFKSSSITSTGIGKILSKNDLIGLSGLFLFCGSLTGITAGMFDNCVYATEMGNAFTGTEITGVPPDLFKYMTGLVAIYNLFEQCPHMTSYGIQSDMFNTLTELTNVSGLFKGVPLTYIPTDLFKFNTKLNNYTSLFQGCVSLTGITDANMFSWSTALDIHYDNIFDGCSNLETIPNGLFMNSSDVDFSSAFNNCFKLQINPWTFYLSSGDTSTRFAGKTIDFYGCFERTSFTGNQGIAPDLWNCTFDSVTSTLCFGGVGNDGTSISNYCDIPIEWGSDGTCVTPTPTPTPSITPSETPSITPSETPMPTPSLIP